MRPKIPKPLRSVSSKYGVRTWLASKDLPLGAYFACIKDNLETLNKLGVAEPHWEIVVVMLAQVLDAEEALFAFMDKKKKDVTADGVWHKVCLAAAWVLVEKYDFDTNGEGPDE